MKMKPWEAEVLVYLGRQFQQHQTTVLVGAIQKELQAKGFPQNERQIGWLLKKWKLERAPRSREGGQDLACYKLDRKLIEHLSLDLKVPRLAPMHCSNCGWDGWVELKRNWRIGEREKSIIENSKDPKESKTCFCPKERNPQLRAYYHLPRKDSIHILGGSVLFDLKMKRPGGGYYGDGGDHFPGPGQLQPESDFHSQW